MNARGIHFYILNFFYSLPLSFSFFLHFSLSRSLALRKLHYSYVYEYTLAEQFINQHIYI